MASSLLCAQCPKTFKDKRSLQKHTSYHKAKVLTCLVCEETFKSRTKYQNHSSIHKESLFQCGECAKKFRPQTSLIAHKSKQVIDNFVVSFNKLNREFHISKTPKFLTIKDHILDYIELTGEPLGSLDIDTSIKE